MSYAGTPAPGPMTLELEATLGAIRVSLDADELTAPAAQDDFHLAAHRLNDLRVRLDGLWPADEDGDKRA